MKNNVIVATKLDAGFDSNGIPRRLYIVTELPENVKTHGTNRIAIIEENYQGKNAVLNNFPSAIFLDDLNVSAAEYRRWMQVKKADEKLKAEWEREVFIEQLYKGREVYAFSQGSWKHGIYVKQGEKKGHHYVIIDGKQMRIIKDEIRIMLDSETEARKRGIKALHEAEKMSDQELLDHLYSEQ